MTMMMRTTLRKVQYAAIVSLPLLPLLLTACNDRQLESERHAPSADRHIILSAGVAPYEGAIGGTTRANSGTGHGDRGTWLRDQEQFGARFLSGSTVERATYSMRGSTAGGDATARAVTGGDARQQPMYSDGATEIKVRGYFPASAADGLTSFSVQANQHSDDPAAMDDGYTMSDLMYAPETTIGLYGTGQALRFEHRMARLCIEMDTGGTSVAEVAVVGGACRTVNIIEPWTLTVGTQLSDEVTPDEPLVVWAGTANQSGTAAPYTWYASCLLPPQVLARTADGGSGAEDTPFLRISYDDGTQTLLTMQPKRIEAGHSYDIRLTLTEQMKEQTLTLGNWEPYNTVTLNGNDPNIYPGTIQQYTVGGTTFRMMLVTGQGDDFLMAETEVTQQLWQDAGMALPAISADDRGSQHPVSTVSYHQGVLNAADFIDRINRATRGQRPDGWVFTLPTRDQWTYAYHGGIYRSTLAFAGSQNLSDVAWHDMFDSSSAHPGHNAEGHTHDVATRLPNELGLYDMAGNVREMVLPVTSDNRIGYMGGSARDGVKSQFQPSSSDAVAADMATPDMGLRLALVRVKTLEEVKKALDSGNTPVTHEAVGWYVGADGTVSPADTDGTAIGIITYISHDGKDIDDDFVGSRLMVMAADNVPATGEQGTDYTVDDEGNAQYVYIVNHVNNWRTDEQYKSRTARNGHRWTAEYHEADDRPAARAAWQYGRTAPLSGFGPTLRWFVPAYSQWTLMANAAATVLSPAGNYLTATYSSSDDREVYVFTRDARQFNRLRASQPAYLRLCFAY